MARREGWSIQPTALTITGILTGIGIVVGGVRWLQQVRDSVDGLDANVAALHRSFDDSVSQFRQDIRDRLNQIQQDEQARSAADERELDRLNAQIQAMDAGMRQLLLQRSDSGRVGDMSTSFAATRPPGANGP